MGQVSRLFAIILTGDQSHRTLEAAAPTPIKARDNKHARERIRTKACKPRMGQITDFGPPEAGKPWAEIGIKSFVATADGGDDAVQVGLSHRRTGRNPETAVEENLGYLSTHRSAREISSHFSRFSRISRSSLFKYQ